MHKHVKFMSIFKFWNTFRNYFWEIEKRILVMRFSKDAQIKIFLRIFVQFSKHAHFCQLPQKIRNIGISLSLSLLSSLCVYCIHLYAPSHLGTSKCNFCDFIQTLQDITNMRPNSLIYAFIRCMS